DADLNDLLPKLATYLGHTGLAGTTVRMCADCRVITMSEQQFDPFAGVSERAPPRTTDDYLRLRESKE
ncbi:MAG: hypothetical protein KGK16_18110, partial [Bradyrhizobium sp.]|nr:hypothetical protein [Bradyrhizobium sp.]